MRDFSDFVLYLILGFDISSESETPFGLQTTCHKPSKAIRKNELSYSKFKENCSIKKYLRFLLSGILGSFLLFLPITPLFILLLL
jgi:hypothetical protein